MLVTHYVLDVLFVIVQLGLGLGRTSNSWTKSILVRCSPAEEEPTLLAWVLFFLLLPFWYLLSVAERLTCVLHQSRLRASKAYLLVWAGEYKEQPASAHRNLAKRVGYPLQLLALFTENIAEVVITITLWVAGYDSPAAVLFALPVILHTTYRVVITLHKGCVRCIACAPGWWSAWTMDADEPSPAVIPMPEVQRARAGEYVVLAAK